MQDILLDENDDLIFQNGDLVVANSDLQHQKLLLLSEKGSWKETPGIGVGAFTYLENEDRATLYNEIRNQFSADGMRVYNIGFDGIDGKIQINADYIR